MTRILAVATALGPHRYAQEEVTAEIGRTVVRDPQQRARLERLHATCGVRTRHLALPLDAYPDLGGFGAANDAFLRVGVDLGEQAVAGAVAAAGLTPADVDLVVSTTSTGVAAPSLDARLVNRLGLRPDVARLPVVGLGCAGGAAGLARVDDVLSARAGDVAVLVAVELCSLTLQRDDASTANLVASGLFGDGAAAVVLTGEDRACDLGVAAPRVVASRSRLYPDTERALGWDVGGWGLRVVLGREVAEVVDENLGHDVTDFLADHGLRPDEVRTWIVHPGGPALLAALERTLGLAEHALDLSRRALAEAGDLSSASVLQVLGETLAVRPAGSGEPAVLLAVGPGLGLELVLLRW